MMYGIGQLFGLLSVVCCLVMPQLKTKGKMLWTNAVNNALVIVNILILDGLGSAVLVCAVAVLQCFVMLGHLKGDTEVTSKENGLFLGLYVACGLLGYRTLVDALPIGGAVFNMLATFQRDEQRTRWLLLINSATFAVYYVLIGSTALLSVSCTIVSATMGLIRYRKSA